MKNHCYIILVNWNGWADTIECLESIFKSDHDNYTVIICDNDSHDNSIQTIIGWCEGSVNVYTSENNKLRNLSFPPCMKPVKYSLYDYTANGDYKQVKDITSLDIINDHNSKVILIKTGKNWGFGIANNIAIEYIYYFKKEIDFVWLLNNDTVIENHTLSNMLAVAKNHNQDNIIIGSVLKYYHRLDKIQAYGGGYFSSITSRVVSATEEFPRKKKKLNFINGASMMISQKALEKNGLFDPNMFMYFEENEYCMRALKNDTDMICCSSYVYHKIQASNPGESGTYKNLCNLYYNKFYALKKHYGNVPILFFILSLIVKFLIPTTNSNYRRAIIYTFSKIIDQSQS